MLTIKVFGPGCANCRKLEEIATKALDQAGFEGRVIKVTDTASIVDAGVLKTPGLSIDGKLVSTGRIPTPETVRQWLREAQLAVRADWGGRST
jgi:small redox-active disulfide protein 2